MRVFFYSMAVLASISLFSCSNEAENDLTDNSTGDSKLYKVSLDVSTFSKTVDPFSKAYTPSDMAPVQTLAYVVCDTLGHPYLGGGITLLTADTITNELPEIKLDLPKGKYHLHFVGTPAKLSNFPAYLNLINFAATAAPRIRLYDHVNEGAYSKSFVLNVNGNSNESVVLQRAVGRLDVILTDLIPTTVSSIKVEMESAATTGFLKAVGPQVYTAFANISRTFAVTADMYNIPNVIFPIYGLSRHSVYPDQPLSRVIITGYDINNTPIVSKTVENVDVIINNKTILTGKLFDVLADPQSSFTPSIDYTWGGESNQEF